MKKNILTVLTLLVFTVAGFAQGIEFEKGDWASVLAEAKKENKIIMTDFYTTWCGPCKIMAKNIFPLKNVGDFYNANFVNYKIDAEKGEGIALAKKYNVTAFPTYIFTDANGKFLHQAVGAFSAENFIEHGKTALDPSKQLGNLIKEDVQVSKADMPAHLRKLSKQYLPFNEKYEAYIKSLNKKELYSEATFNLMRELGGYYAEGFSFDLILKNKEAFAKAIGQKKIDTYFFNKYLSKAYTAKSKKEPVEPVFEEVESNGFDLVDKIRAAMAISGYSYDGKYDEFLKEAPVFLEKYAKGDPESKYRNVFIYAVKFFNKHGGMKKYTLQLADELTAADYQVASANAYIGKAYSEAGDLKTAIRYYQKASDYNEKNGKENASAESVKALKKRMAILEKGDYTFHISGLDQYNGLSFKLYYTSETNIGEGVITKGVEIKDGKCTITGNVKTTAPATWSIYDGDNMKTKGDFVLEPGEFKAKVNGRDLVIDQGWFNYYAYQGLRENSQYLEAQKKFKDFYSKEGDMNNPEVRKEFFTLNDVANKSKKMYYKSTYVHNPNPEVKVLAFFIGGLWHDEFADDEIKKMKAVLGDHYLLKTIEYHKKRNAESAKMRASTAVGKQIKPFEAKDLKGKEFKLEKVLKKNEYVLLEFWASWCGPCRGAIPHLKELHSKYNKKGFEIVSFSLDDKERMWRKASEEEGITWIDTSDLLAYKSPIVKMYGVNGVPYSLLVDKNGTIVYKQIGMSEDLDKKLKELFGF